MAREARKKNVYGTYLIRQFGGGCRPLFQNDQDRVKFIEILKKAKSKFDFKIFGYCLKETDGYELILYDNGSDISKIMKSINISYGMYAACEGKLFKDRYKSYLIEDFPALLKLVREKHNQKKTETSALSQWNGFCVYYDLSTDPYALIDLDLLFHLITPDAEQAKVKLLDYLSSDDTTIVCSNQNTFCEDENCMKSFEDAQAKLLQMASEKGVTVEEWILDKSQRNLLIKEFRQTSTLSLKALGKLFGGLSESTVCKILNKP